MQPEKCFSGTGSVPITVLLTVYNGLPYVREAVESVLQQTWEDFIFLIVDDGSTDGTGQYLDELTDSRVEVIHLERNQGRTIALNHGLEKVATPFVAVIDADDIARPERLSAQLQFMQSHPDIDLVGSDVQYIDAQGALLGVDNYPADHDQLICRMPLVNQFAHAACFFRTEAARKAGGYPLEFKYAQDCGLWLAMLAKGSKVASLPFVLACIRVHPQQSTQDPRLLQVRRNDNYLFANGLLNVPDLPVAAKQASYLRGAGALWLLGNKSASLKWVWRAFCVSPVLFFFNPLVWERFWGARQRKSKRNVPPL